MKLENLIKNAAVKAVCGVNTDIDLTGICYDSRKAQKGCVFIAIKGYKTDGNKFIQNALDAGAAVIITEEKLDKSIPHIVVDNCRRTLAEMACEWYGNPSKDFKLIGITGTNGKTTTSYWIKHILETVKGAKVGLIGTNQIITGSKTLEASRTTPEAPEIQQYFAEMRDNGCEYAVMEVTSHALMLDRVYGCDFDIGVFTNLTQDHLDFHKTMENYRDAKAKLFEMCRKGIFNIDDEAGVYLSQNCKCEKMTYGIDRDDGDIAAKNIKLTAASTSYEALMNGAIDRIMVSVPGKFSAYNSLAAVSAAVSLGLDLHEVALAMRTAQTVRGRAEVVYKEDFTVIIDYAHTPDGIKNILSAAKEYTEGRIICLFGCGGDRDKAKRPMMGELAAQLSDVVIVTSDNPRSENPSAIISDILEGIDVKKVKPAIIENRHDAISYAIKTAKKDDVVLILGKGHENYQEIAGEKHFFDDREEVLKVLGKAVK